MEMKCPECNQSFPTDAEMLEHYAQNHEEERVPEQQLNKRPDGITAISVLWLIFGLINIYLAYQTAGADVSLIQYLNGHGLSGWFNIAIPVEFGLSIATIAIGIVQLAVAYGLLKGKGFAYLPALAVTPTILIVNLASLMLYLSAPSGIDLSVNYGLSGGLVVGGVIWTAIIWQYLRRPYVKSFLGVT